jgi:diguanylate cyclase (GGDEF)-like protein
LSPPPEPAPPLDAPLIEVVRRHLEALKGTPDGAALYMLIERGLKRYGSAGRIEQAFVTFLHSMLARYAKDANTDPATRIKARLIQQQLALYLPEPGAGPAAAGARTAGVTETPPARPAVEPATAAAAPPVAPGAIPGTPAVAVSPAAAPAPPALAPQVATRAAREVPAAPRPPTPEAPATPPTAAAGPRPAPEPVYVSVASAAVPTPSGPQAQVVELGIAADGLATRVTEALTATAVSGSLAPAPPAETALGDFADLKALLVRGLDDLIRERAALRDQLTSAAEYLKAVEADRRKLRAEVGKLRKHGLTDELTGLPRRETFIKSLEAEVSRVRRYGFALALAVLDVDGLERINGQYGREAGDAVLRCYAGEVLAGFRSYDLVARYGADEFAVLFPNTQKDGALRALEKVQKRVAETYLTHGGQSFPLPGFSSVLTLYVPGEKPAQLLARAEAALDHAKLSGERRMVVALPGA